MGTPGPEPGSQIDGLFQLFWFVVSCTVVQKDLTINQYSRLLYVAYIYILISSLAKLNNFNLCIQKCLTALQKDFKSHWFRRYFVFIDEFNARPNHPLDVQIVSIDSSNN